MHGTNPTTVREMVEQVGALLRRQAELYAEQQKLLDELTALHGEKDELLDATRQLRMARAG